MADIQIGTQQVRALRTDARKRLLKLYGEMVTAFKTPVDGIFEALGGTPGLSKQERIDRINQAIAAAKVLKALATSEDQTEQASAIVSVLEDVLVITADRDDAAHKAAKAAQDQVENPLDYDDDDDTDADDL